MGFSPRVFSSVPAFAFAPAAVAVIALGLADAPSGQEAGGVAGAAGVAHQALFDTSDNCLACHNGLTTSAGEDISIGSEWRASMMANAARDPYWQAGVRRETLDHPQHAADIQDECSICHMPMARTEAHLAGRQGQVFAHLPVVDRAAPEDLKAHDGVGCTVCHQITSEGFGTRESFTGGFVIDTAPAAERSIFGPFEIETGLTAIMRSATGFEPAEAAHVQQSELCATCHTLITKSLGPSGDVIGELPEQVMYLEWRHSDYWTKQVSCQACHMPVVAEETPIASVLGDPREGFSRHSFVGGNFFMLGMLNRYRAELGVTALPQELDAAVRRTVRNLQTATAAVRVERAAVSGDRLEIDVAVENQTGHKLPTAYPSRRAWLHVTVRDGGGRAVFESGRVEPSGAIDGNDNDADEARFEPHYTEIRRADEVQIYEAIMGDPQGTPTTGLLTAIGYLKDNRLLPAGFDKVTAEPDIRVAGAALSDTDFTGGGDRVRYSVEVGGRTGPFEVAVELRFQVIAYRWAENLKPYDADEPRRFVRYYESMSAASSEQLAHTTATVR